MKTKILRNARREKMKRKQKIEGRKKRKRETQNAERKWPNMLDFGTFFVMVNGFLKPAWRYSDRSIPKPKF